MCNPKCSLCLFDSSYCQKCSNDNYVLKNNVCLPKNSSICEKNTYYNEENKKCENCDIGCIECYSPQLNSCLSCSNRRKYLENGICVNKCSEGYFLKTELNENKQCFKCNSKCFSCINDSNNCSKCKDGYMLTTNNECKQIVLYGNKFSNKMNK